MSLFILDTDTLTLYQHGNPHVHFAAAKSVEAKHVVVLTVVTVEEQIDGWFKSMRAAKTPAQLARASLAFSLGVQLWGQFKCLPQTEASLAIFDSLVRRKLNVKKNDLRIASIVLDLGATLVARNAVDFSRVPNLSFVDWAAPPPTP
jgi:tRNA(fMet)-specific endonuclease VapC